MWVSKIASMASMEGMESIVLVFFILKAMKISVLFLQEGKRIVVSILPVVLRCVYQVKVIKKKKYPLEFVPVAFKGYEYE